MQVKLVQVPFARDVDLRQESDGEERIAELINYMHLRQKSKAVMCIARESRLSLELKAEVCFLPRVVFQSVHGAVLFVKGPPYTCMVFAQRLLESQYHCASQYH